MHVVIFEPYPQGHRFTYVRHVVNALSGLPVRLTLATSPGAAKSESFIQQLEPLAPRFQIDASYSQVSATPGKFALGQAHAALLAKAAAELKPDHLIMPAADGTLEMLGLRRLSIQSTVYPSEFEAMVMSTSWAYDTPGSMKRRMKSMAWATLVGASGVRTLHVIDPIVMRAYRALTPPIARRTVLSPDPVEALPEVSKADARRRLGIDESGRIVSCVGRMDERKGVDLLIRAFLGAGLGSSDRLLLVGKQMPEISSILSGEAADAVRAGRIITVDGYVTDEKMNLAMAAADLIGVTYRHHSSSSSILIRAAAQGRPVLTTDRGWMGETCRRFGLGTACNIRDAGTLAATFRAALDGSATFVASDASKRFVEFHTVPNAQVFWAQRLRERLNLRAPVAPLTWDWVLETALPLPGGEPRP